MLAARSKPRGAIRRERILPFPSTSATGDLYLLFHAIIIYRWSFLVVLFVEILSSLFRRLVTASYCRCSAQLLRRLPLTQWTPSTQWSAISARRQLLLAAVATLLPTIIIKRFCFYLSHAPDSFRFFLCIAGSSPPARKRKQTDNDPQRVMVCQIAHARFVAVTTEINISKHGDDTCFSCGALNPLSSAFFLFNSILLVTMTEPLCR